MDAELEFFQRSIAGLRAEIGKVLVGQESVVEGVVMSLVAGGHVLLEGVPGLGKTLLVHTLAQCLGLGYRRVQFTPDLMPADIIGTHLLDEDENGKRTIRFQEGPVFTQLLLADEINRATPKTQSALLEAMQERQVTIGGVTRPLPKPFFVLATQNPLEMEGTYPLPEAQLDRFFFKVQVPFPTLDELTEVMERTTGNHTITASPVLDAAGLQRLQKTVRDVVCAPAVMRYAMRLVLSTHPELDAGAPSAKQFLRYGASPRAGQAMVLAGRARALLQGRQRVAIEDIRAVALPALRHRLGRNFDAEAEGMTTEDIVTQLLGEVPEGEGAAQRELAG